MALGQTGSGGIMTGGAGAGDDGPPGISRGATSLPLLWQLFLLQVPSVWVA